MAALTRILEMPKEDASEVFVNALKGVKNKNHHTYNLLQVFRGPLMSSALSNCEPF